MEIAVSSPITKEYFRLDGTPNTSSFEPPVAKDNNDLRDKNDTVLAIEKNDINQLSCRLDTTDSIRYKPTSPPGLDLRREEDRQKTLEAWPLAKYMDTEPVAHSGFFYIGEGDILRCYFCGVEHDEEWMFGEQVDDIEFADWCMIGGRVDDLKSEHARLSKDCPFILGKPVGNVPYLIDQISALKGKPRPYSVFYTTEAARVNSFKNWPKRMRQTPVVLAAAGFYYTGIGDHTICYYCGGGLKDWEDNDDPWEEHARWFNRCPYLYMTKGEQYLKSFQPIEATASHSKNHLEKKNEKINSQIEIEEENKIKREEENNETPSQMEKGFEVECKICVSAEATVVFLPCGHVLACMDCGSKLSSCPVCRCYIDSMVKIYYP